MTFEVRKGPREVKRAIPWVLLLVAACASRPRGDAVDPTRLDWPIAVALDPAIDLLYVVSSNFDAGRTGSTIVPVRLDTLEVLSGSAVEVGSFAGEIVIASREDGLGAMGYVAVRDGDQVEFFAIDRSGDVPVLRCGDTGGQPIPRCDPDHRVSPVGSPEDLVGQDRDPFALGLGESPDGRSRWLYAGSILDGTLAVLPLDAGLIPRSGPSVRLSPGLHSVVDGPVVDGRRRVYASNRLTNAIHVLDVVETTGTVSIRVMDSLAVGQVSSTGDFFRGLAISRDRRTLYAAFRSPASLVVLDIGPDGTMGLRGLVPLHGGPAGVAVAETSRGDRVYVTDFSGDSIYCVDPVLLDVLDRIPVDTGPYGIAIAQGTAGSPRAFVTSFEDHRVVVVDLDEESPTWHQVVARIP